MTGKSEPAAMRLRLFGSPALLVGDAPVPLGRRSRALLAHLELAPGRRSRRDRLCGLLWPERAEVQARASLRQCLVELRGVLGDGIGADREWVWLEPASLPSDHAALEAAIASGLASRLCEFLASVGSECLIDDLEVGEAFIAWSATCRAAAERRMAQAVAERVAAAIDTGDWTGALALADQWLSRDPTDERVTALAIRAERLRAAPAAAQRRFRTLVDALARDGLGKPGGAVTQALEEPLQELDGHMAQSQPVVLARNRGLSLPSKPSIAIMPFVDLAGERASLEFADGMLEEISVALSRFSSLFVIASQSSMTYRGSGKSVQTIARELGVRYLLEGSIRHAGGRVRVTLKLIDASEGEQIWSDRFDGDDADIFELQDRIATQVASLIDATITDAEMQRSLSRQMPSPDAYELNMRANARLYAYSRQSIEEASKLAEEAARLYPDYAWAVAIAGFCHAALLMNGWTDDPSGTRAKAKEYIARAIEIGRDDLMALPVTAGAILNMGGDLEQARALLARALELNADKAFTLFWSGWLELLSDNRALALERFEKALRLNPRSVYRPFMLCGMGNCLFLLERFEEAVIVFTETANLAPHYAPGHLVLAASLARLGRMDEAGRTLRRANACSGNREVQPFRAAVQQVLLRDALALIEASANDGGEAPGQQERMGARH